MSLYFRYGMILNYIMCKLFNFLFPSFIVKYSLYYYVYDFNLSKKYDVLLKDKLNILI